MAEKKKGASKKKPEAEPSAAPPTAPVSPAAPTAEGEKKPLFGAGAAPPAETAAPAVSAASSEPAAPTPTEAPAPVAPTPPATAAAAKSAPEDPLKLAELFAGGEAWLPILEPVLRKLPEVHTFLGPGRDKRIVPLRELTFQALKPNPPEKWKVVVFGQSPYPRVESATGIAMFDAAFQSWKNPRFLQCASMRNMLRAALLWQHGVSPELPQREIPAMLAKYDVVQPAEWFQALLSQGVLLVDASLTRSTDDSIPVARHVEFWAPVAEAMVAAILAAKDKAEPEHQGVLFLWWGAHARGLRGVVDRLAKKHPKVKVRHLDHWHPAARDNRFYIDNHFDKVNKALEELGSTPIGWLPTPGWQERYNAAPETAQRMGGFLKETMDLHKLFLERLQSASEEKMEELPSIEGVMSLPVPTFADAAAPVTKVHPSLSSFVQRSLSFAKKLEARDGAELTDDEVAALYLYTTESPLYRQLNASLRDRDRAKVRPYFGYLRLFLSALSKLKGSTASLYRGVRGDLRAQYAEGSTITWWGVSSCTPKLAVATGFLGGSGRRMLFEVTPGAAYSIRRFSAFTGEEEFILPPGSRLAVEKVEHDASGLSKVKLRELPEQRLLS